MLEPEKVDRYLEKNVIEIAPIAFMRGRTLNDSFVILDEAQNTTSEQMKMFVTRLGFNSKAVITGDVTQIDLPNAKRSGLLEAADVLKNVEGLASTYFDDTDVVRHHLVQRIIRAYDEHKSKLPEGETSTPGSHTNGKAKVAGSALLEKNVELPWKLKPANRTSKASGEGAAIGPPVYFGPKNKDPCGRNKAQRRDVKRHLVILRKHVAGLSDAALSKFVLRASRAIKLRGVVNVLVTSSQELRTLNRRFRQKDQPTDVLSFPL